LNCSRALPSTRRVEAAPLTISVPMQARQTRQQRFILATLTLALAMCGAARAQTDEPGPKSPRVWAVVVGVSKYSKLPGGQQLQFADRDAAAFADALKKAGAHTDNVRLLTGAGATAAAVKAAIGNWLARSAAEGDTVYFFFSGHGFVEREFGEAYLFAHDSDAADPYTTALSVSDLAQALGRRVRARTVIFIADAIRRDLFQPEEDGGERSKSFVRSMGELAAARAGLAIILANGPGEFSREGQRWGGHGVFTKHLVEAIAGGADRNNDSSVTAEEAFEYLSAHLALDTSNKQSPWRTQSSLAHITFSRAVPSHASAEAVARATPAVNTRTPAPPEPAKTEAPKTVPARTEAAKIETAKTEPAKADRGAEVASKNAAPSSVKTEQPATVTTTAPPSATANTSTTVPASVPVNTPVNTKAAPVKPRAAALPDTRAVTASAPPGAVSDNRAVTVVETTALPAPPRPAAAPPRVAAINASPTNGGPAGAAPPSVPITSTTPAPSPLVLQLEAAIQAGNLIEPKSASAWDIYQRLSQQGAASDLGRLKPMLADALMKSGLGIIRGDVRADNISEKVDEFRRAGQLFSRARQLSPESGEMATYEKLSAAQALVALQFYDEAERALAQLQAAKLAAVENTLGLIYAGKLDAWRAERAFTRAVEMEPDWAAPHYNLALHHKGRNDEAALTEFERAAALDPKNASFITALGDEYFGRQQWKQAADAYAKAIALKPADDALHTKLGHALYSQGLREQADREYQKARELRAKQP
jgi:tetratricopeptide (TPR) repeat protein